MPPRSFLAPLLARLDGLDPGVAHALTRIASVLAALVVLLLVYRVLTHVAARLLAEPEGESPLSPRVQRAKTLGPLVTNAIRWIFLFVGFVIVLRELGVDVQALLVSAGVLGLAFSLGAQSLIRDRRFEAEMELRRRIKEAFDREQIRLPVAPRTVLVREAEAKELLT